MADLLRGGFRLTGRDEDVLADVALSNALAIGDLVRLGYFTGVSRARRRAAALVAEGLLRRAFVADGSPSAHSVFAIGPAAVGIVAARTGLNAGELARQARRPLARAFLEHSAFVTAVRLALAEPSSPGVAFVHEPLARHEYWVKEGGARRLHAFKPDGAFRSASPAGETVAFLEADRGFVSHGKWAAKALSYARYVRLGLFAGEYGGAKPVVLTAVESGARRVARLARAAESAEGVPFYFASRESVERGGPGARVWSRGPGGPSFSLAEITEGVPAC